MTGTGRNRASDPTGLRHPARVRVNRGPRGQTRPPCRGRQRASQARVRGCGSNRPRRVARSPRIPSSGDATAGLLRDHHGPVAVGSGRIATTAEDGHVGGERLGERGITVGDAVDRVAGGVGIQCARRGFAQRYRPRRHRCQDQCGDRRSARSPAGCPRPLVAGSRARRGTARPVAASPRQPPPVASVTPGIGALTAALALDRRAGDPASAERAARGTLLDVAV